MCAAQTYWHNCMLSELCNNLISRIRYLDAFAFKDDYFQCRRTKRRAAYLNTIIFIIKEKHVFISCFFFAIRCIGLVKVIGTCRAESGRRIHALCCLFPHNFDYGYRILRPNPEKQYQPHKKSWYAQSHLEIFVNYEITIVTACS